MPRLTKGGLRSYTMGSCQERQTTANQSVSSAADMYALRTNTNRLKPFYCYVIPTVHCMHHFGKQFAGFYGTGAAYPPRSLDRQRA